MPRLNWRALPIVLAVVVFATTAFSSEDAVRIDVVVPDEVHHAWAIAGQLREFATAAEINMTVRIAPREVSTLAADFMLLPLRSLATQVPELQVLELPFFYAGLDGVHRALDGPLSAELQRVARARGWEILAILDEGMQVMSGPRRYDRARNFLGMEFILTRPDPMAEQLLSSLNANLRHIEPQDSEEVMRECAIASRATSLPQMQREKLFLVHQNLALTYHRYESWAIVAPATRWAKFDTRERSKLRHVFEQLASWQREQAAKRTDAILASFRKGGLLLHQVDDEERAAFQRTLPAPTELLPEALDGAMRAKLVRLASAGATPVPGAAASGNELPDPAPRPQQR
jgi:TRAP-type C4-dicarboxylate transport system substrate-binding protein